MINSVDFKHLPIQDLFISGLIIFIMSTIIARFNFNDLCNKNLGAEDYLEIIKNCVFIVLDQIPQFNDINSNQQQRFITLLDIIYDKDIPIAVTASQSLEKFTSSIQLEKPFKRTISRLYELTSKDRNI